MRFPKNNNFNEQTGFAAIYIVIIILGVISYIVVSTTFATLNELEIARNTVKSNQAYYAAEAGIEDAILRLEKNMRRANPLTFTVGEGSSTTAVSDIIGGARAIIAEGDVLNRIRKVSVAYQISTQKASFYYGAQVGDGGVIMQNGSKVKGNIFSNGSVVGLGTITGTAVVAGNGNKIEDLTVEADARAHSCKDSTISGTLTYVSGGSVQSCTAGEVVDGGPNEIQPQDFPITQSMINSWESEAETAGIISGDLTVDEDTSLGPVKIEGNLLVKNATLTVTGTIWATGTFDTGNNVEVRLDEDSYGDLSGVLMADGNVQIRNNAILEGTSSPSSYLLIISNSSSLLENNPAINVKNNALGSILFSPNGLMVINNNVKLIEATAYQLLLKNNAEIEYEIGLSSLEFTSGPEGSWEVASWKEVP